MKLFNSKEDSLYLTKKQWAKLFIAFSILTIVLYIGAMIASLCGSKYFILNFQNEQMDKIEAFLTAHKIMPLLNYWFSVIEFSIVLSFVIKKLPKWYYIVAFYSIAVMLAFVYPPLSSTAFYQIYPFLFYFTIPVIEQKLSKEKFSWKKYGLSALRLGIAIAITYVIQIMIYVIKVGDWSFSNHIMNLSATFIYAIEYDIALAVILFTILLLHKGKGDSNLWATYQPHGGSSQITKKNSSQFYSTKKNLTKTQRSKLTRFWIKFYLVQILGFLLLMVLPFIMGKILEFLVMYLSFAVARYILGFKYSLHYKKESTCITVGAIPLAVLRLI